MLKEDYQKDNLYELLENKCISIFWILLHILHLIL